ncbi:MAG: FMN-binding negative transcriptional regulator [Armatimonadetes bacterium]|nr:FMN-binding negative transcriptional regulator [Armatimonadota bacterium]
MYNLPEFRESDPEVIKAFMRAHPFALITGAGPDGNPVATQVPVLIDELDGNLILKGHVMRQTDHWKGFTANPEVLVVFTGPNCSVKASWYSDKASGGTWNYMAVQARGTLRFTDTNALIEVLRRITNQFEDDPDSGANFEDLPPEYVARLVPAIQAFEIRVSSLMATFKLSQNRDEASFENIIAKLTERGGESAAVAAEMRKNRSIE